VNRDEAKDILLLYRHHTVDEQETPVIKALALAKSDPELARWLEIHCAREFVLREKFRQIPVPAGLKEQIISEQAASRRMVSRRRNIALLSAAVVMVVFALLAFWFDRRGHDDDLLAVYQNQMAGFALRGYAMDLLTNDPVQIRAFLKDNHAPADYDLPRPLQQVAQSGCAVEHWQSGNVSMICFRTGKPLAPGAQSDLWLFVVARDSVKDAPEEILPHYSKVNRLSTATWSQGGKLYFLGTEGNEQDVKKFL